MNINYYTLINFSLYLHDNILSSILYQDYIFSCAMCYKSQKKFYNIHNYTPLIIYIFIYLYISCGFTNYCMTGKKFCGEEVCHPYIRLSNNLFCAQASCFWHKLLQQRKCDKAYILVTTRVKKSELSYNCLQKEL